MAHDGDPRRAPEPAPEPAEKSGLLGALYRRALLSRAKHPSLRGHARMAQRAARLLPYYRFDEARFFDADGAPREVAERRRSGFEALSRELTTRAPRTLAATAELARGVSDVAFVGAYRVPFPFREVVRARLPVGSVLEASEGLRVRDLDGNWYYDVGGSYGVNLFGSEFYKRSIARAAERAGSLGLVLGAYHPVVLENVRRLKALSGLDEVSFHMSGTEAVMQAVRLARYHTGRSHLVRFCGAYHGWWDGVQAGVGNPRPPHESYTLAECSEHTLRALEARDDVACVLVNPLQAMHPNGAPPSDGTLLTGLRRSRYDKDVYARWLRALRALCTRRGIPLIFDEVFLGFRLAPGGAQEYFGVRADLVTYGKSLGGGLPVGVLCGKRSLMRRYREDAPADVCLARGTFNAHPYVMTAMSEFLRHLEEPATQSLYVDLDGLWDRRARGFDESLAEAEVPVRIENLTSVWSANFTQPGRYHWMLQYYLRAQGLAPAWIGTGRMVFPLDVAEAELEEVRRRFVAACARMREDGFFWSEGLTAGSLARRVAWETLRALRG